MAKRKIKAQPVKFLPYQQKWLADESRVKFWQKSRRIGASFCEAYYAVETAATGRGNYYYVSHQKDETRQFIEDCKFFIAMMEEKGVVLQSDPKLDSLMFEQRFDSGKHIRTLSRESAALRGKGNSGDVVCIDEAAFLTTFPDVLKAALPMTMHGAKIHILSTHDGIANPFNMEVVNITKGKRPWSLHTTTLDDALDDGLFMNVLAQKLKGDDGKPLAATVAEQDTWRANVINECGGHHDEELFCIPAGSARRYFPMDLLEAASTRDLQLVSWQPDKSRHPDFVNEPDTVRDAELRAFYLTEVLPFLDGGGKRYLGVDIGRVNDLTSICILRQLDNGIKSCNFAELFDCPFENIAQVITLIIKELRDCGKYGGLWIDGHGNGAHIAEKMLQAFPDVNSIKASNEFYSKNFGLLKNAIEEMKIKIPEDDELKIDLSLVERIDGVPKIPKQERKANTFGGTRHGDSAISLCFANGCYEANKESGQIERVKAQPVGGLRAAYLNSHGCGNINYGGYV